MPKEITRDIEIPVSQPVQRGSVFATAMEEAASMLQELGARRVFCDDAAAYLKQKGLIASFEKFREKRKNTAKPG